MNFAMATLGLKEMGKFLWEGREKSLPSWLSQFSFLVFGGGCYASFHQKPVVKIIQLISFSSCVVVWNASLLKVFSVKINGSKKMETLRIIRLVKYNAFLSQLLQYFRVSIEGSFISVAKYKLL